MSLEPDKDDFSMLMDVARYIAKSAEASRKSGSATAFALAESFKEKLVKAKERRSQRYQELQLPHRHVCDLIAMHLDIEPNEVLEAAVDSDTNIELLDRLLSKNGILGMLVYYQDGPGYEIDSGRFNPNAVADVTIKRLYFTDGMDSAMKEMVLGIYKLSNVDISLKNITDALFVTKFDIEAENGNSVAVSYNLLAQLIDPSVKLNKDWGDLPKTEVGLRQKINFEGDFNSFVDFLKQTKLDLEMVVNFIYDKNLYRRDLINEKKRIEAILNSATVHQVESTVRIWCKQMERALVQYQQLRRENEFVGPLVEIEYWRRQLARFTSIVEFLQDTPCKTHIQFLEACKSKLLKVWSKHECAVIEAKNECADNMRYLYALEQFCHPLYRCEATELLQHIPPLLHAIRMTYTTSRYYNNTGNVTALLVKVSNQMINVCRAYLNCNGAKTVWNQKKQVVLDKIKVCLDMYLKYYQCFKHIQEEMKEAGESPFECSEMYVFGKFETFKKRVEEIVDVLETTTRYSILQSSKIENIDLFANKFKSFFQHISTQKYDALNHRLPHFDKDYNEFKQNVVDTEWELEEFVGSSLEKNTNVYNVLRLLRRFEKLKLECLHLDERYLEAMEMFQKELEDLRDRYNEDRQTPLLPRNMPPVSGRIMWIRHLYRRMEECMEVFITKPRVMRHRDVQKCIQLYNAMAMVFIHYEQIYHEAWYKFAGQVRACLNTPILTKDPKTKRYKVNFHPYILEVIRESEYIYKLDLPVPDVGQVLVFCKEKILNSYEVIKGLVERNDNIRGNIPPLFIPLIRLQLMKMEDAFRPGFSVITWTSTKIPEYCDEVNGVLDYIEMFVKEVKDMKEARIDEVLDAIASTTLVHLPNVALIPSEFLEENKKYMDQGVKEIELKSSTAERAVIDLIEKFLSVIEQPELQDKKYDWLDPDKAIKPVGSASRLNVSPEAAFREIDRNAPLDLNSIHNDCLELFAFFNMKLSEALVKCIKLSLEQIKKRTASLRDDSSAMNSPVMKTNMELQIPIIVINPTLDEIQNYFTQVITNLQNTMKFVCMWGQRGTKKKAIREKPLKFKEVAQLVAKTPPADRNYYKIVTENKEIIRIFMSLQGVMYLLKPDVAKLLQKYLDYSYLWAENRDDEIEEFCNQNPLTVEIAEKFQSFENRADMIRDLPAYHIVDSIQIDMEKFKLALLVESDAWKHILGKNLGKRYRGKLLELVDFIKNREKVLNKPIKDLDDCRLAMACLELIRENFIEIDLDLITMEEAYNIFSKYKIDIPKEDTERVESLRFNFNNMVNHAKTVQENICEVQGPLLEELTEGVSKFRDEVEAFDIDFELNGPMIPGLSAREASDRVLAFQDRFDELWRKFEMYSSGEKLFGLEVNDYPILHKRKKEFNLLNKLYGLYLAVNHSIDGYFDILWVDVDTEVIFAELQEFQNRCRKLPKGMKDWPAFLDLKKKIDDFSETCPLLELMANKAMKERHWKRITAVTGYSFDIDSPTFTLRNVMEAPLLQFKDDVEDICISAVKEKDIEAKLKQVIADWSIVELSFSQFKTRGELLLKGTETGEIIMALEDSLMIMNSLLSNRYNAPFKKDIQTWVHKLVDTSEILEKWLIVQNLWVYLEAVFVGGDIAKQLPGEAKRFNNIDKSWIKIMTRAHELPNAVECCTGDETMGQLLPHLLEQLETCQKSLTGYLESKRLCFPRFFFISDPVLLEILGQSSDPTSIQNHLPSLFDAVYRVEFDPKKNDTIIAMLSDLGESVNFEKPVVCAGGVEIWLNTLLEMVKETVKTVIAGQAQLLSDPEYDFIQGFIPLCAQAGLVGIQILWTKESEVAIRKAKVDRMIMKITNARFLDLLNALIDLTGKDLSKRERTRYETMVTIHVHQRQVECASANRYALPFPLTFRPPGLNRRTSRHPPGIRRRITVPTDRPPDINRGIYLSVLQALTGRLPDIPQASTGDILSASRHQPEDYCPDRPSPRYQSGDITFRPPGITRRVSRHPPGVNRGIFRSAFRHQPEDSRSNRPSHKHQPRDYRSNLAPLGIKHSVPPHNHLFSWKSWNCHLRPFPHRKRKKSVTKIWHPSRHDEDDSDLPPPKDPQSPDADEDEATKTQLMVDMQRFGLSIDGSLDELHHRMKTFPKEGPAAAGVTFLLALSSRMSPENPTDPPIRKSAGGIPRKATEPFMWKPVIDVPQKEAERPV
ncbi:hypothetical protein Zmor_006553 [Zophobas morio]|uniref:Dynein heavy chain 8, axonemal n=1 Tax=Zophobas morio TaxID=2755281 RepID=A0AA38MNK7_9CUCU|nr:hypothetical protein Zmor_006553 [Zophobas morio]